MPRGDNPGAGNKGGARKGSGRKKSDATIKAQLFRDRLVKKVEPRVDEFIAATMDLALGHFKEEEGPDGERRVYKTSPNQKAVAHLWDQMIGKARETVEWTGQNGGPIRFTVTRIGREK